MGACREDHLRGQSGDSHSPAPAERQGGLTPPEAARDLTRWSGAKNSTARSRVREDFGHCPQTGDAPETLSSKPNEEGQMPEDAPLRVEAWPIEKVIACASNPRKRTTTAVDKLAASRFLLSPISGWA